MRRRLVFFLCILSHLLISGGNKLSPKNEIAKRNSQIQEEVNAGWNFKHIIWIIIKCYVKIWIFHLIPVIYNQIVFILCYLFPPLVVVFAVLNTFFAFLRLLYMFICCILKKDSKCHVLMAYFSTLLSKTNTVTHIRVFF